MNERIKLLVEQAVPEPSVFKVEHFQGDVGYWSSTHPVWQSELYQKDKEHFTCVPLYTLEDLEKFAELIVRECADIADRRPNVLINQTVGGWIKQHFGVES